MSDKNWAYGTLPYQIMEGLHLVLRNWLFKQNPNE